MNNIGGTSKFIAFFDECGNHSMSKIDKDFPFFLLSGIIIERQVYSEEIIPAISNLKLQFWNHEGINLHSRDIRRSNGPFSFMMIPHYREKFMSLLNDIMGKQKYTLFATGIRKDAHLKQYGIQAENPYTLALEFIMERIVHFLDIHNETALPCVVEARGKKEDKDLEYAFLKIMTSGTSYRPADQFKKLDCPLVFRSKRDNIAGIQIADLCAYPCARHALKPDTQNRAYEIIKDHIYTQGTVSGWKIFP